MTDRRDLLRLAGFLLALLVVTGAVLLATGGGGSSSDSSKASEGQGTVDGLVETVSADQLVLKPSDGRAAMTFKIRATEAPNFDVFHLQQHAADGFPTRVTFIREDGQLYALRADDAPVPNG